MTLSMTSRRLPAPAPATTLAGDTPFSRHGVREARFLAVAAAAILALTAATGPAHAQNQRHSQVVPSDPVAEMLRAKGERYHRAPDTAQDPDELRRTQALNAEIVAQNDLAENQDRANQTALAAAQRLWQADLDQAHAEADAARTRHQADLRAAGEAQARYQRDMAEWRASTVACQRGDATRCYPGRQSPN